MSDTLIYSDLLDEEPDLAPIVENFVARLPSMVEKLKQASQKADWQQLHNAAHELKGVSGSMGFPQLMQVVNRVEAKAKAQTGEGLDILITEIDALCARVSTRQ